MPYMAFEPCTSRLRQRGGRGGGFQDDRHVPQYICKNNAVNPYLEVILTCFNGNCRSWFCLQRILVEMQGAGGVWCRHPPHPLPSPPCTYILAACKYYRPRSTQTTYRNIWFSMGMQKQQIHLNEHKLEISGNYINIVNYAFPSGVYSDPS